jgi:RNA polymerase sigma-70 factor (ECF subfamily)
MERCDRSKDISELIKSAQKGDQDAFGSIITEYKKLVAHIVFRMVRNPMDREDLGQEIFIRIYQKLSTFRFESKFSTWISKIAYHTCINYLNKKSTEMLRFYESVDKDWDNAICDTLTPLTELENNERLRRVNREIMNMPVNYRIVITLFHLQEMSYQEIGEILDIPAGTVKSYLYRGRQYLKERLIEEYQQQVI